jgi:large subunit ribosomal protein L24
VKTTKPTKQRKKLYQAPLHKRYRRFSASLSPKLKSSHNTNSIPVRTGDNVRIMRGDYKGFEGKVTSVNRKDYRVFVEGATREKVDGSTALVPIHPSKVMIIRLNLDDKRRREILKRKGGVVEKAKLAEEKVVEEAEPKPTKRKRKRRKKAQKKATESGGT